MATSRLNLTRDQLATFLKDHEQIRQFERLFADVQQLEPTTLNDLAITASTAGQQAVEALDATAQLAQETAYQAETKAQQALDLIAQIVQDAVSTAETKAQQALDSLAELRQQVELLALAPPVREFKRARYGQFVDTTTQTAAANTPKAITYNTTEVSAGVYIGSPTSRIYVDTESIYNFLFSIQIDKTSGGVGIFWVWPRINGVDVPNSNSQVRIQGNDAEQLVTVGYFFDLKAGDYVEIMFAVDDASVRMDTFAASGFYPAIPSIIMTVTNNIQGVQS